MPLTKVEKVPALNLDTCDESGRSLSVIHSRTTTGLVVSVLELLTPEPLVKALVDGGHDLARALTTIAQREPGKANRWVRLLLVTLLDSIAPPTPDKKERMRVAAAQADTQVFAALLPDDSPEQNFVAQLHDCIWTFPLVVRIDAEAGDTRVLKYSYTVTHDSDRIEWHRFLARANRPPARPRSVFDIALGEIAVQYPTRAIGEAMTYYIGITAPDELAIRDPFLAAWIGGSSLKPHKVTKTGHTGQVLFRVAAAPPGSTNRYG